MLLKKSPDLRYSEVTPQSTYLNRRRFLAAVPLAGAALLTTRAKAAAKLSAIKGPFSTDEKPTPYQDVASYNNFYEFGTAKDQPSKNAGRLKTSPWTIAVEGAVAKPQVFDLADVMKMASLEERIYRHRCVEAWSIVVPWIGFPLNVLIKAVEPTAKAKFVAFQSLYDSKYMLSERFAGIAFPYVEGLRLDEAMHPLALLCFGMYGQELPNQDGAPVRLVVPWKYGFQEHQVHRENQVRREGAAHHLESFQLARIRFLFECEPHRRSSPLEPGLRTPPGRVPQAQDPHV
jgi:methionine sulfoxide reductase catalytic subunit